MGADRPVQLQADKDTSMNEFRDFVLKYLDDDVTPAEALAKFESFKCKHAKKDAEHGRLCKEQNLKHLKGLTLYFDLYNPLAALCAFDLRIHFAHQNRKQ